jgi:hypothetical protein
VAAKETAEINVKESVIAVTETALKKYLIP